jgi:hypothetical protein
MKEEIFQDKVAEIINENENLEEIETAREEFKDFMSKPVHLPRPTGEVDKFLFSFDNMGLQSTFSEAAQSKLFQLMKKIKFVSEKKELEALLDDVTLYLKYQKEFSTDLVQTMDQNEEVEIDEKLTVLEDKKDELSNTHFVEMYEEEFEDWEKQGKF